MLADDCVYKDSTLHTYVGYYESDTVTPQFQSNVDLGFGFTRLYVLDEDLYATGSLVGGNVFKYRSGSSQWEAQFSSPGVISNIYGLAIYDGSLVFGAFDAPYLHMESNGTITTVGTGTNGRIHDLIVYKSDLIAAGNFTAAGGNPTNFIARWNGRNWLALGRGTDGPVHNMVTYDGKLVVSGNFVEAGGEPAYHIAAWDGENWEALGTGITADIPFAQVISDLKVNGKELFVSGTFNQAGTINTSNIAKWNGEYWSEVGGGLTSPGGSMEIYQNQLYVVNARDVGNNFFLRLE
ncbi:MAG: hypothetical protein ACFB10_26725 [Salibacteraceae bacterium]